MSSLSSRETEYATITQCHFELVESLTNEPTEDSDGKDNHDLLALLLPPKGRGDDEIVRIPCLRTAKNSTIVRLQPMMSHRSSKKKRLSDTFLPRWDKNSHFHEELQIPTTTTQEGGWFCLLVQARAREGLAIALSPEKGYVKGSTYEIILGDRGNTVVTLRRKSSSSTKKGEPPDILVVQRPARVCQENAWTRYWICWYQGKLYVGIGERPGEQCLAFLDDIARQDTPPRDDQQVCHVGFCNAGTGDRQPPVALRIRNVQLISLSTKSVLAEKLTNIQEEDLQFASLGEDEMDEETKALLLQYQQECSKARARAEKFGVPYKEPPTFIPWSQARRLKANPQQGFVTGFDLDDPEEKAKQDKRKQRFGLVAATNNSQEGGGEGMKPEQEQQRQASDAHMEDDEDDKNNLPVEQAWDNVNVVQLQRVDPPSHLWKANDKDKAADAANEEEDAIAADVTLMPEKIHLFSIDWSAFKQIRTNDVMKYFDIYGPTYVEWLGDLSCNIHFQDKYSAARALRNLSTELPSPPPPRLGSDESEARDELQEEKEERNSSHHPADLGRMGWRLAKKVLRKLGNDRWGRHGTTARVLFRVATSLDILHERPTSWPKPPDGFSTKVVLGPSSGRRGSGRQGDGSQKTTKKSKKAKRNREDRPHSQGGGGSSKEKDVVLNDKGEPSLLDRGLKATRGGFSLEDLEKERSKKKAKLENPPAS